VAEIIFTTIAGSHLYGMATPQSDGDQLALLLWEGQSALGDFLHA
jgi:hypothetical protein